MTEFWWKGDCRTTGTMWRRWRSIHREFNRDWCRRNFIVRWKFRGCGLTVAILLLHFRHSRSTDEWARRKSRDYKSFRHSWHQHECVGRKNLIVKHCFVDPTHCANPRDLLVLLFSRKFFPSPCRRSCDWRMKSDGNQRQTIHLRSDDLLEILHNTKTAEQLAERPRQINNSRLAQVPGLLRLNKHRILLWRIFGNVSISYHSIAPDCTLENTCSL